MSPHVAVCPSAGMGHLAPFLGLSSALSAAPYTCSVTLVIIVPLITAAESSELASFFSSHPRIRRLDFHIDLASTPDNVDPFFSRYDAIGRSSHHLARRLATLTPPISAAFSDFLLTKGFNTTLPPTLPNYTVITTSARFLSLMAHLPSVVESPPPPGQPVEIPGLDPIPADNIPPPFLDPGHIFTSMVVSNAQHFGLSKGILVNTFESFEPGTLSAFRSGNALRNVLAPVFAVGPLHGRVGADEKRGGLVSWLDEQPENSVLYVSFGNRTAMSRDQIRELGVGLERSGFRFIWVVKTSMVDKEERDELGDMLGKELHEKLCKKGKVVQWVSQREILGHKAVGGFVSHCGWNSVVEAAQHGVPVVAWPLHGDQRVNAGVVEKAGLGVWERGWGGGKVVGATEICEKVELVMGNEGLRKSATTVGTEAKTACGDGGSSTAAMMSIMEKLKQE